MKICQQTPNLVKIGQQGYFFADNIYLPRKHFCATLLTVNRSSTIQRERIVNFHCKNGYA
jgi:hypothetical protein